jgi:hypothetical protein
MAPYKTSGLDPKLVDKAYAGMKKRKAKMKKEKCSMPCTKNGGKMKCKCYK